MFCPNCGKESVENSIFCIYCGAQLNAAPPQPQAPYQPAPTPPVPPFYPPMKWYKFLIYFSLFATAVIGVLTGLNFLTGNIYSAQELGLTTDIVYTFYGESLRVVDLVYALANFTLAAFAVYVRFQLSAFKKDAPTLLYILHAMGVVISIAYNIALSVLFGIEIEFATLIGSTIGTAVHVWLNYIYFQKRKWLFVY